MIGNCAALPLSFSILEAAVANTPETVAAFEKEKFTVVALDDDEV